MSILDRKLSPAERRLRVALGVRIGKSNRAIAKELGVDEGTVRRDRKYLVTPEHLRPVKKERPKPPKEVKPAYDPNDAASLELHLRCVSKALRLWIVQEKMVLDEIEYVLHEAGKRLYVGRGSVRNLPVPTKRPAELITLTRPDGSPWGDFTPQSRLLGRLARPLACVLFTAP